jgi:predicted nucleotidyltransferase
VPEAELRRKGTLVIPEIMANIDAIRALCREYGVARLDVFGSATTDAFDPDRSDIDFLVDYARETDLGPWMSRHIEFRDELAALLGRPVDLVMDGGLRNKYFIRSVNATRQLLYAA